MLFSLLFPINLFALVWTTILPRLGLVSAVPLPFFQPHDVNTEQPATFWNQHIQNIDVSSHLSLVSTRENRPTLWFYRFSQSPELELQKSTAVDTKIEQFYFRSSSKIKGYCYIGMGCLTSDRTFKVEKDHMTSDLKSPKECGHENGLGVIIYPLLK